MVLLHFLEQQQLNVAFGWCCSSIIFLRWRWRIWCNAVLLKFWRSKIHDIVCEQSKWLTSLGGGPSIEVNDLFRLLLAQISIRLSNNTRQTLCYFPGLNIWHQRMLTSLGGDGSAARKYQCDKCLKTLFACWRKFNSHKCKENYLLWLFFFPNMFTIYSKWFWINREHVGEKDKYEW